MRRPAPRARTIRIAVVVAIAVVLATVRIVTLVARYQHATTPRAEGYRAYGTVQGTTFWLKAAGRTTFLLRTTGGFSSGCRYAGPDLADPRLNALFPGSDYLDVCHVSGLRGPEMIVDLVPASFGPATAHLSDGTSVTQSGWIEPSRVTPGLLPSEQLDVVFVDRGATVEDTSFG